MERERQIDKLKRNRSKIDDLWNHTNDNVGLSENSVPLHPMVNDHYPY